MFRFSHIKTSISSFPVFVIDKFLSKKVCDKIYYEIIKHSKYDDSVMGGRNRINKGSNNFKEFISKTIYANRLFNKINSFSFYKKLDKILKINFKNNKWYSKHRPARFSKSNYSSQKPRTKLELKKISKNNAKSNLFAYLDVDFSAATGGYARKAHRDNETRLINFIIYLNSVPKKCGGTLKIFNQKMRKHTVEEKYLRFPKEKKLKLVKKLQASKGLAVIFQSSPDSYHQVTKFLSKNNKKRVFIYGSFSLNRPVIWKYFFKRQIYYYNPRSKKLKNKYKNVLKKNKYRFEQITNYVRV